MDTLYKCEFESPSAEYKMTRLNERAEGLFHLECQELTVGRRGKQEDGRKNREQFLFSMSLIFIKRFVTSLLYQI